VTAQKQRRKISHDYKPVSVTGPVNRNRARVIWEDGKLYVFAKDDGSATHVLDAPEPPKPRGSQRATKTYDVETAAGPMSFSVTGCNCGFRLGKISATSLLARAAAQTTPANLPGHNHPATAEQGEEVSA
jgi:hypothetical protein